MGRKHSRIMRVCAIAWLLIFLSSCPTSPEPEVYAVSFATDGGSAVAVQEVQKEGKATRPAGDTTKAGYTFENWYADDACATVWDFDTPITQDTILYAKWTVATYTVSYAANGANSGSVPSDQTKTHGEDLTLASNTGNLARTGYTFAGWDTQADGSGTAYAEGSSCTANAGVTLYAKW